MPRIANASTSQVNMLGLGDGRYGGTSSSTTMTTTMSTSQLNPMTASPRVGGTSPNPGRKSPRPGRQIEPAPSSAHSVGKTTAVPPPSSIRTTKSAMLGMNRSPSHGTSSNGLNNIFSPSLSPLRSRSPLRTRRVIAELPTIQNDSAPRKPSRNIVRAVEAGNEALLPEFTDISKTSASKSKSSRAPPDRTRTRSSPSLKQVMRLGTLKQKASTLPQTQQDLPQSSRSKPLSEMRRRTYSTTASDDDDFSRRSGGGGGMNSESPYRRLRSERRRNWWRLQNLGRMKLGHMLQVLIVVAVTGLVWESHHKALFAAEQLSQFKEEESLLLLHLQKIEQHSIQLHENLSRLAKSGLHAPAAAANEKDNGEVDFDLIHKQTQQLYQMEEELNHEVRTLQTRIQQSARNHIVSEFGEGPVQVVLEIDFGHTGKPDGPNRISILLWHDTPHAAWIWLEQISRNLWNGAKIDWQQGHILDAVPLDEDPMGSKIEFLEQSQHSHEAWTVGLRESESGMLTMYVNLQDNTNAHKAETCVGKVIDGFDALQRLLEVSRTQLQQQQEGGNNNPVISIKRASAMHVTKK